MDTNRVRALWLIENLLQASYNSGYYAGKGYDVSGDDSEKQLHRGSLAARNIARRDLTEWVNRTRFLMAGMVRMADEARRMLE